MLRLGASLRSCARPPPAVASVRGLSVRCGDVLLRRGLASAAVNGSSAAAASAVPPPWRMTFMQEQAALEAAAAAAAAKAAPAVVEVAPKSYARSRCSSLFLPSAVRSTSRRPRALLSHMGVLAQAGLVRHTPPNATSSGHTLLLPLGARVLAKLDSLLHAELASFDAQQVHSFDAAPSTKAKDAPYPAALSSSLSQLTLLVADDFRSGTIRRAALRSDPAHPPGAASAPLWSALKRTHDVALFDTRHDAGLERYHALVDAFRLTLLHACGKQQVHVVDTKPDRSGLAAVDADLAHEAHVEVETHGSSSLLRCTHCEYAAKPGRALSLPTAAKPDAANSSDFFPLALQQSTKTWALQLISESFPPHVIEQLKLADPATPWKVEMMYEPGTSAHATTDGADAPKLLYMVLMRADHEVNLDAVSDHVSVPQLQRVDNAGQAIDILQQNGAVTDELLKLNSDAASSPLPSLTFDARPELLIDQALIPTDVDLDLEVIEDHDAEEQAEEQAEAAEQDLDDAAAVAEKAPAALEDTNLRTRMEKSLMSSVSKLKPGESIDMVQLEMQSRGLNVRAAKAQLVAEAVGAQKIQHELLEREQQEEQQLEKLKLEVDADDAAPSYDPTLQPAVDADADANESLPAEAAVFSALIPHFEYSKQGFFRMATEGETCAICEEGTLKRVHTHVLANTAFIGRQELVRDEVEDEPEPIRTKRQKLKPKPKPKKKKLFLHTSFGRFSSCDLLAHLALKHLHTPPPATAGPNPLNAVPTVFFPPLVAPYQVVLIPVTTQDTNPRDRLRTVPPSASEAAAAAEAAIHASEELHDAFITASIQAAPLPSLDMTFPSLEGEILIDDHYSLSTAARVQQSLSLGVPILLLLSASSIAKGYVTLLLNKRGVPVEPRKIAIDGLPQLIARMVQSNSTTIVQAKKLAKQQQLEKQQAAEDMEEAEGEEADEAED